MWPNKIKTLKKKIPKRLRKDEDRGGGGNVCHPHQINYSSVKSNNIDKIMLGLCVVVIFLIENCWAGYACLSNPCIFGVCMDDINSTYSCYCIDGYTGVQCQTNWDECWSSPCLNGGTCIDGVAQYNCTCPDGFAGSNCEENLDECLSNPCQNGATCHDKDNGYTCTCHPGYTGEHCETDVAVCETGNGERCHHGGECIEGPGLDFTCDCAPGWTGQFCDTEINECESGPCQNGGVCIDKVATYACACTMGFTGTNCEEEILKCDHSPCQNRALCLMEEGAPVCYCVPDYHGERCELQYDECQLGPRCMNGGVCIDGVDDYSCSCPPGLTGRLCECLMVGDDEIDCNYTATITTPRISESTTSGQDTTAYTTYDTTYVPKSTEKPIFTTFSYKTSSESGTTAGGTSTSVITTTTTADQTTTGSRLSSTSFQSSTTIPVSAQTFRTPVASTEHPYSTVSSVDSTDIYTDTSTVTQHTTTDDSYTSRYSPAETTTESHTEIPEFTRFSTRPTPGHFTTHEATQPVPTDAPDHITHFFTEFPLYFTTTSTTPSGVSVSTDQSPRPTSETPTTVITTELPTTTHYLSSSTTVSTTEIPFVPTQTPTTTQIPTVTSTAVVSNYTESPDCAKITCLNGGTCTSSSINGTKCVCPFNYTGDQCEQKLSIRRAAFGGDSYVSHRIYLNGVTEEKSLDEILPLKIELKARTRATDGLIILAAGTGNRGGHYMALFLHRGLLQFQFSCGLQTMLLSELEAPINSGHEFMIHAELDFSRNHSHCNASLRVNDTLAMSGDQPTWLNTNAKTRFGVRRKVVEVTNGDDGKNFVKNVWLHLGGAPQLDQTIGLFNDLPAGQGFTGCLHSLKVNGNKREIFSDAFDGFNVQECGSLACLSNPCRNGAICIEAEDEDEDAGDESENDVHNHHSFFTSLLSNNNKDKETDNGGDKWRCKCTTGFMGPTCEISICDNNPCQYGGTCVTFPGSGYLCLCPLGKHGHYCEHNLEITTPTFSGTINGLSSYMAYPLPIPLEHTVQFSFKISPTTMQQISLLAFIGQNGNHDDKSDHIAVSFIQGYVMLTWNLGAGPRRIFTQKPVEWKTDGTENVYQIEVGRVGRTAWLTVDNSVNISGNAPGGMTKFEVNPVLYLGGHSVGNFSSLPHDLPLHSGFQGCIFDLQLISGHISIPLLETKGVRGRGVGQCGTRECHRHACQHDGACLQHGATFTCICQEGWHGPLCAQRSNPCEGGNNRCALDARCVPLVTGYECDCPVGKTGKYCYQVIKHLSDVSLTGRRSYLMIKWPSVESDIYFGRLLTANGFDKVEQRMSEKLRSAFLYDEPMPVKLIVPSHTAQQQSRVQHFSVEFQIRPLSERGLLLFFGDLEDNKDGQIGFVSVSLQGGVIEYRTAGPQGHMTVVRSSRILAIGEWHKVKVIQAGRRMTLWVEGSSTSALTPSFNSFVDSNTQIYIGGLPDLARLPQHAISGYPVPYRGCFRQLTVSGIRVILNESTIISSKNIQDCDGTGCGGDSCDAGGHCWLDEKMKPHCKCPETAKGDRCELPASCHVVKCKNGGECLRNGQCDCPNGWGGYFCEIATSKHSTPSFNGNSYLIVPPPRIPVKDKRNGGLNARIKPVMQISVNFSTIHANSMLIWTGSDNFLGLGLEQGHVRVASSELIGVNKTLDVPSAGFLADGAWHNIKIQVDPDNLDIYVDGRITYSESNNKNLQQIFSSSSSSSIISSKNSSLLMQEKFFIGGFPHNISVSSHTNSIFYQPFKGCLDDIDFGNGFIAQQDDFSLFEGRNIGECAQFDEFTND